MATSTKTTTSLAQVIEKLVKNIEDPELFSSIGKGSLCKLISIATKKKNSTQRRDYLKYQWDNGTLKEEVQQIKNSHSKPIEIPSKITLRGGCGSDEILTSLFKTHENSGSGSCFYKSLSQAFFNVEEEHWHIRYIIVNYVCNNFQILKKDFEFYNKDDFDLYGTPSKYRREHLNSRTFATPFEIFIFVKIFNISIRLLKNHPDKNKKDRYVLMMQIPPDNVEKPSNCINLRFSGKFDNGHIEYLENLNCSNNFSSKITETYLYKNCLLKKSCKFNQKEVETLPTTMDNEGLKEIPPVSDDSCLNNDDLHFTTHKNDLSESYADNSSNNVDSSNCNLIEDFGLENNRITSIDLNDLPYDISPTNVLEEPVITLRNLKSPENPKIFEISSTDVDEDPAATLRNLKSPVNLKIFEDIQIDDNSNNSDDINGEKKDFDRNVDNNTPVSDRVDNSEDDYVSSQDEEDISDDLRQKPKSKRSAEERPNIPPDENKNKSNSPPSERTKYPYYVGEVSFLTQSVLVDDKQMSVDLLRQVIKQYMRTDLRCHCPLSFYAGFRFNSTNSVGYANCQVRSHGAKYIFQVVERDAQYIQVDVSCSTDVKFVHKPHDQPFTQVRGERRKQIRELSKYKSSRGIYLNNCDKSAEELQKNGYTDKECNQHVILKINSERKAMGRRTIESLDIQDFTQLWIDEQKLKDNYLREVNLPLSILLFTERQLEAINPSMPAVLHLDSTGANLRIPSDLHCPRGYYYALVYRATKSTIPLAQMITAKQDETTITYFLKQHQKIFLKSFAPSQIKAIVTDWSWPSMHSILSVYNNGMNISEYLILTYEYYVDSSKKPKGMTFLLSCCAHIMHRVAIEIEVQDLGDIKCFLMKCMGKLILCRSKKMMDATFKLIVIILLTKNKATADKAIEKLTKLSDDNLNIDVDDLLEEINKINSEKTDDNYENLINFKLTNAIYSKSPFYIHFYSLLEAIQNLLQSTEKELTKTNIYYSPEFLDYLLIFFMPYASLWSGIVLDLVDPNISRVSNAYVESHNKTYKEHILEGRRDLSIGEAIRVMKAYIECLLKEEYLFRLRVDETQQFFKYPPTKEAAADHSSNEIWARSKKEFDKVKPKNTRARYLSNKNFINVQKKISANDDELDINLNVNKETSQKSHKPNTKSEKEPNIKRNRKNTVSFTESLKALTFLDNGMVDDLQYYLRSNNKSIRFAHYTANERVFFRDRNFTISPFDLHSVADYNEWVSGELIDAFASTIMVDWCDMTYIPHHLLQRAFGRLSGLKLDNQLAIHYHNQELGKKLLSVYCYESHWRVLLVDIESEELILLDPRAKSTDRDRIKKAFLKLIDDCAVLSPLRTLKKINWEINEGPSSRPYQPRGDSSNCGVYCMYYLLCIYEQKPFDQNFNPEEFREKIAHQLILRADDAQERCLYCAKTIESVSITIKCSICKREIHEGCKTCEDNVSQHENNFEKTSKKSRKKQKVNRQTSNLSAFTCHMCKLYNYI